MTRPYGRQTRPTSIRLPFDLDEKLRDITLTTGVDRSAWIEYACRLRLVGDAEEWARRYARERRLRERAEEKLRRVQQALEDDRT